MKPRIRRVDGLWLCGTSLHPRLGIGPACGFSPVQAYESWKTLGIAKPVHFSVQPNNSPF